VVVETLETVTFKYWGTAVVAVSVVRSSVDTVLVSVVGILTVWYTTVGTVVVKTTSDPLMNVVVSSCVKIWVCTMVSVIKTVVVAVETGLALLLLLAFAANALSVTDTSSKAT